MNDYSGISKPFESQAMEDKRQATIYLIAAFVYGLSMFAIGCFGIPFYIKYFFGYFVSIEPKSYPGSLALILLTTLELFIFSTMFYGLIGLIQLTRAHRHNYFVNKYRCNALLTLKALKEVTEDKETKNTLLLQTTQFVFSPQPSDSVGELDTPGQSKISVFLSKLIGTLEKA